MDDIDFDFLKSPPKSIATSYESSNVSCGIDVRFAKRKSGKESVEMAETIAKVDGLINEISRLESQNNQLLIQLKDFRRTAEEVQQLYNKEKQEHEAIKKNFITLKAKYEQIDTDFTNNAMVSEQMKARLAEYEGRPINFNDLVVKYVKLMNKLDGHDVLKYLCDKDLLEKLRDYCASMKLKIPPKNSPKKHTIVKKSKVETEEVQSNLYESSFKSSNNFQCSSCHLRLESKNIKTTTEVVAVQCNLLEQCEKRNTQSKDQMTECFTTKRDQSSQYISTMITRQTNTEKIVRKDVQTMFPEAQTEPQIDVILNTYCKWSYIRSVSPLKELPQSLSTKQISKTFHSIGTCTMLCNVRRRIDYLPPNSSFNIKQEVITPIASPIPNTQRFKTNRQCNATLSNVSANPNNLSQQQSLLDLFISTANTSSLGELTFNAFNELWQIFGKMLLNLLQTSSAGIANAHLNSAINQQQFINWLLELYMSSHLQTTASAQTQTNEEEIVPMTSSSPVRFNVSTTNEFSPNIVRPQAQKSTSQGANGFENDNDTVLGSTGNTDVEYVNRRNYTNSVPNDEFSEVFNTMNKEVQQRSTFPKSNKFQNNYSESDFFAEEILTDQQVLIPQNKLKKKQSKALKRLSKNKHHRKKLLKNKKDPINAIESKTAFVEIPNNKSEHIETGVDFLLMFANSQQYEDKLNKNEQIHKKESQKEHEDDFNFVKPFNLSPKKPKNIDSPPSKDTYLISRTRHNTKSRSFRRIDHPSIFEDSNSEDDMQNEFDIQNENNTNLECKNHIIGLKEDSQELKLDNLSNSPTIAKSNERQTLISNNNNNICDIAVPENSTLTHLSTTAFKNTTLETFNTSLSDLSTSKQTQSDNLLKDFLLPAIPNDDNISEMRNKMSIILKSSDTQNKGSSSNDVIEDEYISTENKAAVSNMKNGIKTNSLSLLTDDSEMFENKEIDASDFEIDFELSSDNESFVSDADDNMPLNNKQDVKRNYSKISAHNKSHIIDSKSEDSFELRTENDQQKAIDKPIETNNNLDSHIETASIEYPIKKDGDYHNDSFYLENNFMIVEDTDEENGQCNSPSPNDKSNTLNSSNISTLLNTSLCNEVLTDSIITIVDGELNVGNKKSSPNSKRKRKSEYEAEVQPCKRSERLKAKHMILESSLNLSFTPIEIGKYTKRPENFSHKAEYQIATRKYLPNRISNKNSENKVTETCDVKSTEANLQMGFFKERQPGEMNNIMVLKNQKKMYMPSSNVDVVQNNTQNSKPSDSSLQESENYAVQTTMQTLPNDEPKKNENESETNLHEAFIKSYDSPQSPKATENGERNSAPALVVIPTERLPQYVPKRDKQTLLELLINSYQREAKQNLTIKECKQQNMILNELEKEVTEYYHNKTEFNSDSSTIPLINKLLYICPDYKTIYQSLIAISQKLESTQTAEKDLPSIIQEMPPRHLSKSMQSLLPVLRNFVKINPNFCLELMKQIDSVLFRSKQDNTFGLEHSLNLTQLYLMTCKVQEETLGLQKNPVRFFIVKCLYYYVHKAILLIHEVLMWYPTVLPYREDKTYDRSDALITVIQYILMNTKYDMDKTDLRSKTLLSKLRYEYHLEPFKPKVEEVVSVLVDKIKNNKFHNLFLAFGLLCKRLGVNYTQNTILFLHLLPLAQEYYRLALQTNEFDNCIANLLEIMSIILKSFPSNMDVSLYLNEFSRFLNAFERPIIQEAALCSILRLQRFGFDECYKTLQHFQPTFELEIRTQAMLKSFAYRRSLKFWKSKQ